ncbi:hypothetical protein SASPL_104462 [Salvia splendens]|uniref:Uncharacterized protein n=1 Tax=Salvia splendens TaxID=180675 RepID=A0A8X8YNM9_SALSN|nr:hypothetical protein SASPL_104462 [Salvia splendens]
MSLFSNIHYDEELLDLGHQLELLRIKFQPRKHVEGGLRFTVLWSIDGTMHYLSFDELGLKDCSVVISGFKRNLETIPICIGFFYVGDALYMVGGESCTKFNSIILKPTKCLWSAVPPPYGLFSESWTLWVAPLL